jgi:hypothetical protein
MMSTYPERLRIKADEIRAKARIAADPDIRRHYVVMAEEYDRLAMHVERASKNEMMAPGWRTPR